MNRYLVFAAIVLGVAALVSRGADPAGTRPATQTGVDGSRSIGTGPSSASSADGSTLVLKRDSSGQFHMTAQVNGEDVRFLVDTGADVVALTVEDARRLGIDVEPEQFEPVGQTASGVGYGLPVRLDRVEIEGHEIADVEAVVVDGLGTNLLGQSVLRRLGRMELRGDRMTILAAS